MNKTLTEFRSSLSESSPPSHLTICLQSLWYDGKGDWNKAHDLVNDLTSQDAARVHAYLHRKEGDIGNADYWYLRSGESRPNISLDEEWELLVLRYSDNKL